MKKKYLVPSIEVTSVHVLCSTGEMSNGQTITKYTVKERGDDEIYESEDGNYGDLW